LSPKKGFGDAVFTTMRALPLVRIDCLLGHLLTNDEGEATVTRLQKLDVLGPQRNQPSMCGKKNFCFC
jgi:hypothetical protein